ncbi:DNA-processing protein DprA [Nonomuraea sp. NPDC050310]|uniref:DNA-processing protein DprA n=1 Tax=Nonomuraea sp. NPDC050310 TaxID=3154935 RepID=UPI0033CA2646
MIANEEQLALLTLCALRADTTTLDWHLLGRTCQSSAHLAMLLAGDIPEDSPVARRMLPVLRQALPDVKAARARAEAELEAAEAAGAGLVTVLDAAYPANLRLVPNLPPFLFYRGALNARDARSVAVVGTREVTPEGQARASRMARGLTEAGVIVYSGLAKGVDTCAHTAALAAGGRTAAVMGTGIASKIYPAQNTRLAQDIVEAGGVLFSQFWPTSTPARWTFPRRNITMSGATLGSVVVEASHTSGAKMQARIAAEHGKQVFLLRSLVAAQPWAAKMLADGRAVEVGELADVLERLAEPARIQRASWQRRQLAEADQLLLTDL